MLLSNITTTIASTITLFLNTPIDKVAYVDINNECKYVEIDRPFSKPEFKTCEFKDSSFEVVYVDPCLEKVTKNGIKASQEKCSLEYSNILLMRLKKGL